VADGSFRLTDRFDRDLFGPHGQATTTARFRRGTPVVEHADELLMLKFTIGSEVYQVSATTRRAALCMYKMPTSTDTASTCTPTTRTEVRC
jgi:hypothetical protein